MAGLMGGDSSDSSAGPVKVPAWKVALKAQQAGKAAGAAAVAEVTASAGGGSPSKAVPAWKLKNMQAAAQKPGGGTLGGLAAAGGRGGVAAMLQAAHSSREGSAQASRDNSGRNSPAYSDDDGEEELAGHGDRDSRGTPVDYGAPAKSDRSDSASGASAGNSGAATPRSAGAASPFGREKPSLRKAARMAMMLNRFAPPDAGPSEPKAPAWKLANSQAAARRKAEYEESGRASGPPPAPAPTPVPSGANSRSETPHGSASLSRPGTDMRSDMGSISRPGTDMSGAYTSEDDDYGRGRSTGRQVSDSDYESGGMTDIPSGADDSELSDDGGAGDAYRPSSAPPTLFGVSMKKALSRPADRVEQAERKAERMEADTHRVGSRDSFGASAYYGADASGAYFSESELSMTTTNVSGSESDRKPSKQLSTLERIMGKAAETARAQQAQQGGGGGGPDHRAQAKSSGPPMTEAEARRHAVSYAAGPLDRAAGRAPPPRGHRLTDQTLTWEEDSTRTPAEHRASAARGRDLISRIIHKAGGGGGGGVGGAGLDGAADRRRVMGLDPDARMDVRPAADPAPRPYQVTHAQEQAARAAFDSALQGGSGGGGEEAAVHVKDAAAKFGGVAHHAAGEEVPAWKKKNLEAAMAARESAAAWVASKAKGSADCSADATLLDDSGENEAGAANDLASSSSSSSSSASGLPPPPPGAFQFGGGGGSSGGVLSAVMALRRDIDRLATQRASAGLKPEKHGALEVVLLTAPDSAHWSARAPQRGSAAVAKEAEPAKRFLSVSTGALYLATYFTLLDTDGFVDCHGRAALGRRGGGSGSSEKVCDLLKASVEVEESGLSLCGFQLKILRSAADGSGDGIILRPTRLAEFMEWASVIQQVVDEASVTAQLLKGLPDGEQRRRDARGRLFRMPGDTQGLLGGGGGGGTADSRYASTKRDLYRLQMAEERDKRRLLAEGLEQQASAAAAGSVEPSGAEASGRLMQALYDVANRPRAVAEQTDAAARAATAGRVATATTRPMAFLFEATKDRHVFEFDHAEADRMMADLERLKQAPLRLPKPPATGSGGGKPDYSIGTILDATSGSRLGPSPVNRALFFRGFARKDGKAYSAGLSWLEDYRAMQKELDAMEFSTDRTLGYLADHKHRFYAMAHGDHANSGGGGQQRHVATKASASVPGGGVATASPGLLSRHPAAAVPMLADINPKQFGAQALSVYDHV